MLSQQLIQELHDIIQTESGQDLDMEVVAEIGTGLVAYFNLLAEINHNQNTAQL